ncbi:unnamed protein product [Cuscuta europaea]|uniref:Calmodulin-binding protein n=1 Tax=Cuscuta europaea TaxID=41803 RepID=A0A9P1EED6_CUSEU|nr:unnamed protein product [Cuscuta europaea]
MEVMMPSPPSEFNFISAPSSPKGFGTFFYSATEVSVAAEIGAGGRVPFDWEEEAGPRKPKEDSSGDFAFDFSGQLEMTHISAADELFDGGKIKPLKPPPRVLYEGKEKESPKSPRSPKWRVKDAFSPRHRRKDSDSFSAALEQSRKGEDDEDPSIQRRGRERRGNPTAAGWNSRRKKTRSLSPFRATNLLIDRNEIIETDNNPCSPSSSSIATWYRKWRLKDLLLFRSASEGRASSKKMMMETRYAMLKKNHQEDVKNSSFRSTESVGSSSSRRRGPVSAHELHYTMNRAASEEMKRKTYLPYKQGLLGCLGFHPAAAVSDFSRGLASMSMPRSR